MSLEIPPPAAPAAPTASPTAPSAAPASAASPDGALRAPRLPPLHALIAFESAARLGGFAPAAAELCITPSAVSHRIRHLEAQLGCTLFERHPGGVRPTAAGERHLAVVREAFGTLGRIAALPQPAPRRLTLGLPPTFARNLLIPRLPAFWRQWPEVDVEVVLAMPMDERPGRHDVDIRFGPSPPDERPGHRLFEDVLDVLASPGTLQARPLRQLADLAGAELLRCPLLPWRPWFEAVGLSLPEPRRGPLFTDLGILLEAGASDLGLVLCARRIAAPWLASGRLLAPLADAVAPVPSPSSYWLSVADGELRRPEVAAFVEWAKLTFG